VNRSSTLAVVGLGYVGLPLSIAMTQAGYDVVGVDVDADRVAALRNGRSYVRDVSDATVDVALERGFRPTTDYEAVSDAAAVSVCVPTPLRKTGRPDVSLVASSAERLARVIPDECVVIVESTVYPGATANLVAPLLENEGKTVGEDVYVAFSPERIDREGSGDDWVRTRRGLSGGAQTDR
jgi:UDP-N-acetyl-D-glucosamine dehydrogenase